MINLFINTEGTVNIEIYFYKESERFFNYILYDSDKDYSDNYSLFFSNKNFHISITFELRLKIIIFGVLFTFLDFECMIKCS